jgi:hypothetical protein
LILVNQIEIDLPKQLRALEKLLVGLESMKPKMIVCSGRLFSERATENEAAE